MHFCSFGDKFQTLDIQTRDMTIQRLKVQDDYQDFVKTSKSIDHWKDLGKRTQQMEKILTFSYT